MVPDHFANHSKKRLAISEGSAVEQSVNPIYRPQGLWELPKKKDGLAADKLTQFPINIGGFLVSNAEILDEADKVVKWSTGCVSNLHANPKQR